MARQQKSQQELDYIKMLQSNQKVMKVETEMLELRERNLRASISIFELQPKWDKIQKELEIRNKPELKRLEDEAKLESNPKPIL